MRKISSTEKMKSETLLRDIVVMPYREPKRSRPSGSVPLKVPQDPRARAENVTPDKGAFPAPFDFEVSAQIGGVNVLAWNYEGLNALPSGMEYEVAIAVGEGRQRGITASSPFSDERRSEPETWHYLLRTGRNPLHHKALDQSGQEIGDAKGVMMWYRVRVVQGDRKGAWTPLVEVECNRWRTARREPSRLFGILGFFSF